MGGRVLLRIEDHDRQRSRRAFEAALCADLAWLGFEPDAEPCRQSERSAIHSDALADLERRGLAYGCDCSRRVIAEAANAADASGSGGGGDGSELRYPGTCRGAGRSIDAGATARVRLDDVEVVVDDLIQGFGVQRPQAQCGDLLAADRERNWTYQFAVTVDDFEQGVDTVIRGADLLASCGRQILLARLLGRDEPPRFAHHALLLRPDGAKLSKSLGDAGVAELRAAGRSPHEVFGLAARAGGLTPSADPLSCLEFGRTLLERWPRLRTCAPAAPGQATRPMS